MPDDARHPPDDDDPPPSTDDPPPSTEDPPAGDEDPPPDSDDDPPDEPDVPVEGDDPDAPPLDAAIVQRFLTSKLARTTAENAIRKLVPRNEVEDIASDALVRALRAPPPHAEIVFPGWLAPIARRTAIRWLEKRKRRSAYEGPMPVQVAREDDYTGEAVETEDPTETAYDPETDEEPEKLLGDDLDRMIGEHARDQEIRAIIHEHSEEKRSYADIAAARGMTEAQLAGRIKRFKKKYTARVQRRRAFLFFLKALGVTVAAAIVVAVAWYLLHRTGPDDIRPDPSRFEPPATPSASAPVFLQALPPPPEPSVEPVPPRPPRLKP